MAPLLALIQGTLLPRLEEIQACQTMQQFESERLEHAIADLRTTILLQFAEMRADLMACQARMEDVLVTLRESDAGASGETEGAMPVKKSLLN